jgi:hypothetical protein
MDTINDSALDAPYNSFDAPIPGQSLTDEPGNYPWEHPPKQTDPNQILENLWEKLTDVDTSEELILMLESGVPVEAIARIITFTGFAEGEFTPDVGILIAQPLMKMIAAIGIRAGVKELKISLEDLSNKKTIKRIVNLKQAKKRIEKISSKMEAPTQQLPQQGNGLLARPQMSMEE